MKAQIVAIRGCLLPSLRSSSPARRCNRRRLHRAFVPATSYRPSRSSVRRPVPRPPASFTSGIAGWLADRGLRLGDRAVCARAAGRAAGAGLAACHDGCRPSLRAESRVRHRSPRSRACLRFSPRAMPWSRRITPGWAAQARTPTWSASAKRARHLIWCVRPDGCPACRRGRALPSGDTRRAATPRCLRLSSPGPMRPNCVWSGLRRRRPSPMSPRSSNNPVGDPLWGALLSYTVWSWSHVFGAAPDTIVPATSRPTIERTAKDCLESADDLNRLRNDAAALRGEPVIPDAHWRTLLAENAPTAQPGGPPVFLAQGDEDPVIPPPLTRDFARRVCRERTPVRYLAMPGVDHYTAAARSAAAAADWIAARFADAPPPDDCAALQ